MVFLIVMIRSRLYFRPGGLSFESHFSSASDAPNTVIPAGQIESPPKPDRNRAFFHNSRSVDLVQGIYKNLSSADKLLKVEVDGTEKLFLLSNSTKLVCQPTGFINTVDSSNQTKAANTVFIEDQRDGEGSWGIPWGVKVNRDQVGITVNSNSPAQLFLAYYSNRINTYLVSSLPEVVYVWFKECR